MVARRRLERSHAQVVSVRAARILSATGLCCAASLAAPPPAGAEPSELPPQFAYNYGETDTPRSAGMGGALRALGSGTTAPFLNAANMGLNRSYHIQAFGQFTPEAARQNYGGVIIDSTRRFSGGVAVVGGFMDADGIDRSHLDLRIPLAFAISDAVHVGASGRYMMLDQEGLGPLGASRTSGGLFDPDDAPSGREPLVNTITFDAGLTIAATQGLHISIAGHNLSYPNNGLLPTMLGGGLGYRTDDFSIEVDGVADFNSYKEMSPRVMAGGELLVADQVPIRLGYRFDMLSGSGESQSHALCGGAGYVDPRFAVDAGVRRTLVGPSATTIVVGFSFFLESLGLPIQDY
jgi:hypothetical protein